MLFDNAYLKQLLQEQLATFVKDARMIPRMDRNTKRCFTEYIRMFRWFKDVPGYVLKNRRELRRKCIDGCGRESTHRQVVESIYDLMTALCELQCHHKGVELESPAVEELRVTYEEKKKGYQQQIGIFWFLFVYFLQLFLNL